MSASPALLQARRVGAGLLAVTAVWISLGMAPAQPDQPVDADFKIAQIEDMDDANNEITEGAPQQAVVNGWTANELLKLLVQQNAQQSREQPRDDRPTALLLIGVLGIALFGLTSGSAAGRAPVATSAWTVPTSPTPALRNPTDGETTPSSLASGKPLEGPTMPPVDGAAADAGHRDAGPDPCPAGPTSGNRLARSTAAAVAWARGHRVVTAIVVATIVGALVVSAVVMSLNGGDAASQEAEAKAAAGRACQQLEDVLPTRPTNNASLEYLDALSDDVVAQMETKCARNLELLRGYAGAATSGS